MRFAVLLFGLLISAACPAIEVGQPAPPLSAKLADGSEFVLANHRGEVVIVDFWACWCAPCIEELKALQTLHEKYHDRGLTVLAVNTDDAEDLAKAAKIAASLPFAKAQAADVDAEGYGRIWRLPITFIVDRQGVLRFDGGSGPRHSFDLISLEQLVTPLLAEPR